MGNIRLCYSLLFSVPALRPSYSKCAAYADMFGGSYLFWPCFTGPRCARWVHPEDFVQVLRGPVPK